MSMDIIKSKIQRLIHTHKTTNPFEIIKGLNVILVYYPLDGVRGFYQYFQRNNIIYLDDRLSEHEQTFVLAHEMGHMFLHKRSNAIFMDTRTQFNTSRYENEADRFAINLLISDDLLSEYQQYTVSQLARITGYKKELVKLRLRN